MKSAKCKDFHIHHTSVAYYTIAHLHMMRLSSARAQWRRRASLAVRGMVEAVRRSDMARLIVRIFLEIM